MTPKYDGSPRVASSSSSVHYATLSPFLTLRLGHIAKAQALRPYTDQGWVTLWGTVVGEPEVRDTYTNLRLAVDRVQIEGEEHSVIRARAAQAVVAGGTSRR